MVVGDGRVVGREGSLSHANQSKIKEKILTRSDHRLVRFCVCVRACVRRCAKSVNNKSTATERVRCKPVVVLRSGSRFGDDSAVAEEESRRRREGRRLS